MLSISQSIFCRANARVCLSWASFGEMRGSAFKGKAEESCILLLNIITYIHATSHSHKQPQKSQKEPHFIWSPLQMRQNQYSCMQKQSSLSQAKELTTQGSSSLGKANLESIQQTKTNLDTLIEDLNLKLHSHFHKKQSELIEQYKLQLIAAQKQLNDLKSSTNEEQIKNKMMERKKELEKERHQLIQTNMFFSNKCEDYKRKLALLLAEGKELEKELLFLDAQINNAYQKKYQLPAQQEQTPSKHTPFPSQQESLPVIQNKTHTLPLFSDRKPAEKPLNNSNKLANSVSVRDTTKKAILQESMASKGKRNIVRNTEAPLSKLAGKVISKTALQELFQRTVDEVKGKRKGKGVTNLKGEEFTDYQKKQIMQEFLCQEEVKRKIYEIIFQNEDKRILPGSFQPESTKVKISFEDIS